MKKIIALAFVGMVSAIVLVGCSPKTETSTSTSAPTNNVSTNK